MNDCICLKGNMLFIPSKSLHDIKLSGNIENIFAETNLRSKKGFISDFYNPNASLIQNHILKSCKHFEFCSSKNENFIVIGDFNADFNIYL